MREPRGAGQDVGNVSTPNLVWAVDHDFPKQASLCAPLVHAQWRAPDLMPGVFLAGVGLLIDRDQTHEPH